MNNRDAARPYWGSGMPAELGAGSRKKTFTLPLKFSSTLHFFAPPPTASFASPHHMTGAYREAARTTNLAVKGAGNSVKNVLLVDAVVERAVDHVTTFVRQGGVGVEDDDGKRIQRAAESLNAVLTARIPPKDPKVRRVAITEDAIKSVFHLPISKAAAELGVGLTVLKKFCRIYEISRWPFRKLKSLDKLVSTVSSINDSSSAIERSMVRVHHQCFCYVFFVSGDDISTHSATIAHFIRSHTVSSSKRPKCSWSRPSSSTVRSSASARRHTSLSTASAAKTALPRITERLRDRFFLG